MSLRITSIMRLRFRTSPKFAKPLASSPIATTSRRQPDASKLQDCSERTGRMGFHLHVTARGGERATPARLASSSRAEAIRDRSGPLRVIFGPQRRPERCPLHPDEQTSPGADSRSVWRQKVHNRSLQNLHQPVSLRVKSCRVATNYARGNPAISRPSLR